MTRSRAPRTIERVKATVPAPGEVAGRDYDHAGTITDDSLLAHTPVTQAD